MIREYIVPLSDDEAFYGFKDVAAPLIRCKDCRNFMRKRPQDDFDACSILFEMVDVPLQVTEESFCSWAERMDKE